MQVDFTQIISMQEVGVMNHALSLAKNFTNISMPRNPPRNKHKFQNPNHKQDMQMEIDSLLCLANHHGSLSLNAQFHQQTQE